MSMHRPADIEGKLHLYLKPVQIKARERFLKICEEHGNGLWAFERLEWEIYIDNIDLYESLSEEEKFDLNTFMSAFRSLYKS